MIDLHCPILSSIEDGAKIMNDSSAMARETVAEGISQILAIPHYKKGCWANEKETVLRGITAVQQE